MSPTFNSEVCRCVDGCSGHWFGAKEHCIWLMQEMHIELYCKRQEKLVEDYVSQINPVESATSVHVTYPHVYDTIP